MRLTVGPLPAAVYWRRRAVVLVGIAAVVLVVSYACGGDGGSSAGPREGATNGVTATPASTAPGLPAPVASAPSPAGLGACTDAEMSVVASAAAAQVQSGRPIEVTITMRNISVRTCSRDVGADVAELRLVDGIKIIWSSDDCNANTGHDVRSLRPGEQLSYTLRWNGRRTRTGTGAVTCALPPLPQPGRYDLIARLDQILSAPFALQIT